jgi:hypothetical protein
MAQLIGDDPNNVAAFVNANKRVQSIDEESSDRNDAYARGHLFWRWLDSRGAVKKTVDLVILQRMSWKEGLEEATGFPWSILAITERDWSQKEVEKLQAKDTTSR